MKNSKKQHLINEEIRVSQVRLVDYGVLNTPEALSIAKENELDLVLVGSTSSPPVCKLMNYEKFIYEQNKKEKPKILELKEIKIGPNTSENDLNYRIKHVIEFLKKGHKVKITMQFKGREVVYLDSAQELILKMVVSVEEYGVAESVPKLEGKRLFVSIKPKGKK